MPNDTDETNVRDIREAVGATQIQCCVWSGVSPVTWRMYEANPRAIRNARKRRACDATAERLRKMLQERAA